MLENKKTLYGAHFRAVADKAQRVMSSLGRLMPNMGGPRERRRELLVSVVHGVLLYGAPARAYSLQLCPRASLLWLPSSGVQLSGACAPTGPSRTRRR